MGEQQNTSTFPRSFALPIQVLMIQTASTSTKQLPELQLLFYLLGNCYLCFYVKVYYLLLRDYQ